MDQITRHLLNIWSISVFAKSMLSDYESDEGSESRFHFGKRNIELPGSSLSSKAMTIWDVITWVLLQVSVIIDRYYVDPTSPLL